MSGSRNLAIGRALLWCGAARAIPNPSLVARATRRRGSTQPIMNGSTPGYRTDLGDFLHDLLVFIEAQVGRAKTHGDDQRAAVDAASGVVPLIKTRLEGNQFTRSTFMLALGEQIDGPEWRNWWDNFGNLQPSLFQHEADKLLDAITALKEAIASERRASGRL